MNELWYVYKGNQWSVFDGIGCEIFCEDESSAKYIAWYFNNNNVSGRGTIDEDLAAAQSDYRAYQRVKKVLDNK